jgi:hypothetical protein
LRRHSLTTRPIERMREETIPPFDVFIEVVADPTLVQDWSFPGRDGGISARPG